MATSSGRTPWHRDLPPGTAEIDTDDDEFLVVDAWPREVFAPHVHDEFNWIVPMRAGRIVVAVEGREHTIDANHWICIFPRTPHAVVHVSDRTEILSLFIPELAMHKAWRAHVPAMPALGERCVIGGGGAIAQGLALAWGEVRFARRPRDEVDRALERFVTGWIWRAYRRELEVAETWQLRLRVRLGPDGDRIHRYLDTHLADVPVDWDAVGGQVGWSRRMLQRRFVGALGLAPRAVLAGMRLERARELLRDGDRAIGDIAFACGFASQSHFATAFKVEFGVSPSQARRTASEPR